MENKGKDNREKKSCVSKATVDGGTVQKKKKKIK